MADITQITAAYRLDFSANTPEAKAWMENRYGGREILFDLPHDDADALRLSSRRLRRRDFR